MEENDKALPNVPEPVVQFKSISDRDVCTVLSEEHPDTTLIEISGYGLRINFNMQYLRTYEDVISASEAVGTMFKEIMLERLLGSKHKE